MWDRADLLNRIANGLFAASAVLIVYGVLWTLAHLPWFVLKHVEVSGSAPHVTRAQVEAIVRTEMKGTFFTLNLPQLRRAFEKLPWVRDVKLRRHWPDRLEVSVVEHVPLARWGNLALVNTHGEVFRAAYDGKLPVFIGPEGTSKEVAIQYEYFRRNLAPLGSMPVLVQLTPRRAWQVRVEGGPTIQLGRDDIEARLARYIEAYDRTIATLNRRIDYVDLRYSNGFAVRIPELGSGHAAPQRGKTKPKQGQRSARSEA
ncbi:MAG: cell division protein FtsQ/DivIB [Burkholderiales bacterium]